MAILKDYTEQPTCEVELNIESVNDMSVKFNICFRSGHSFLPYIQNQYAV